MLDVKKRILGTFAELLHDLDTILVPPLIPEHFAFNIRISFFFHFRTHHLIEIRHLDTKALASMLVNLKINLGHNFSGTAEDLTPTYSFFVRSYVALYLPGFVRCLGVTLESDPYGLHLHVRRVITFRTIDHQRLGVPRLESSHPSIDLCVVVSFSDWEVSIMYASDPVWYIFGRYGGLHLIIRSLSFFSGWLNIFLRRSKILQKLRIQSGKLKVYLIECVVKRSILGDTGCLVPLSVLVNSDEARSQTAHLSQGNGYFGTCSLRILGFFQLNGGD
jgi:hypothetical protein